MTHFSVDLLRDLDNLLDEELRATTMTAQSRDADGGMLIEDDDDGVELRCVRWSFR